MKAHFEAASDAPVVGNAGRGIGILEGLLVLVALVYWFAPAVPMAYPRAYPIAVIVLGGFLLLLRYQWFRDTQDSRHVAVRAAAMVVFITGVAAMAGGTPASLMSLYLLPVLAVALMLDRAALWLFFASIVLARLLLASAAAGLAVPPVAGLSALVLETVPLLVAGLLAAQLAATNELASRRMRQMSQRDRLTGLHDQHSFQKLCVSQHQRAAAERLPYAVLKVDIDDLRLINREFGEETGDRILVIVADALRRSTRRQDLIARLGGDEFGILLPGAEPTEAEAVANRIRHNVWATHLDIGNRAHRVSVCVGMANFPGDGDDPRVLLGQAEETLCREKAWRKRESGVPTESAV